MNETEMESKVWESPVLEGGCDGMRKNLGLKVHDKDNVATIFAEVTAGTTVEVRDKEGKSEKIFVWENIPYGHKIALREIRRGEPICKYGETIGSASREIRKGKYVHVHNPDSTRGRGDL